MSKYRVTANELRLRSTPNSQTNRNIIAVLSNGQLVEKIADSGPDWWEVKTLKSGAPGATGFVANRYLGQFRLKQLKLRLRFPLQLQPRFLRAL